MAGADHADVTADAASLAAVLEHTRARTLGLTGGLEPQLLERQHSQIMSPMVWDLAHIGNYEELWLLRRTAGQRSICEQYDDMYDAFRHERWQRGELPLLGASAARDYIDIVRERARRLVERIDPGDPDPLLRDAFVVGLVVQHEQQHDETLLATRQIMGRASPPVPLLPPGAGAAGDAADHAGAPARARELRGREVLVPGGSFQMGTDRIAEPWALDNELEPHDVHVDAFWIDAGPVTNEAFLAFIDDGGYERPELWTPEGWRWRCEDQADRPMYWVRCHALDAWHGTPCAGEAATASHGWAVLRFGALAALDPHEPVQHVSWYEADAYARWAGRRLPTEAEWEKAASWHPTQGKRRYPWGAAAPTTSQANLGQRRDGPAPAGAYAAGTSPYGVEQLVGDVWEWTSTSFDGYPGFRSFPYREYSEAFFGDRYRVLRGGSWATHPLVARATFRNWDLPCRRQLFAGFRCARSER